MFGKNRKERPYVFVRCVSCGDVKKVYRGDIPSNDSPMCSRCFCPMVIYSTVTDRFIVETGDQNE